MYILVHGLFGTLFSLFSNISSDTSAQSRTDSYALVEQFIGRSPIFGRGFRTFLPSYRILDNQLLGTTIEMGVVGLGALLGLMITTIIACRQVRRTVADESARRLAQACIASVASALVGFAFYDGLSFPMGAGIFFFVVGCGGSLAGLARSGKDGMLQLTRREL
jgi:O-antigen ligase